MEIVSQVLERYGLAAAIMVVLLGASGYAIRALWKKNQELNKALTEFVEGEAEKRSAMREAVTKELNDVREQLRAETRYFAERLEQLQERRVNETQEVTREVVKHVEQVKNAVERITYAMDTLTNAVNRRD